jgi:hypothetical protein
MSHSQPHPTGSVYDIRWNEVCPSLILVRSLRVSVMFRVLLLATLGTIATEWGWSVIVDFFPESSFQRQQPIEGPDANVSSGSAAMIAASPMADPLMIVAEGSSLVDHSADGGGAQSELIGLAKEGQQAAVVIEPWNSDSLLIQSIRKGLDLTGPLGRAWVWCCRPFARLTDTELGWGRQLCMSLCGLWTIAVWALLGGAIARIAALHLTRGETIGPIEALKDGAGRWLTLMGAPLIPLLGCLVLALPLMLTGLMMRSDFLALAIGLSWGLVIIWGLLLAVILIGLMIGWPLMWATMAVERTDAFDGVSRCYAYVYQRPLHLAFYLVVAAALGWLGQTLVEVFAVAAGMLGQWAIGLGAGLERITLLTVPLTSNPASGGSAPAWAQEMSGMTAIGATGIQFWNSALHLLVISYAVGYLWSAAVGIYLLLRRLVDSTEMDEIAISQQSHDLPLLEDDPSGVPAVKR